LCGKPILKATARQLPQAGGLFVCVHVGLLLLRLFSCNRRWLLMAQVTQTTRNIRVRGQRVRCFSPRIGQLFQITSLFLEKIGLFFEIIGPLFQIIGLFSEKIDLFFGGACGVPGYL